MKFADLQALDPRLPTVRWFTFLPLRPLSVILQAFLCTAVHSGWLKP